MPTEEKLAKPVSANAASLNDLAALYCEVGDYASAEPLFRQAMEIRRVALGESHPDHAASNAAEKGQAGQQGDSREDAATFDQKDPGTGQHAECPEAGEHPIHPTGEPQAGLIEPTAVDHRLRQ